MKVRIPVKVSRIEKIDYIIETYKPDELIDYIKEYGIKGINIDYEEIVEICEETVLNVYDEDIEIEKD